MATKYTVQHVGRPFGPCETIHESDWKDYSKHASKNAAFRAIDKYHVHLSPHTWDNHYRVVAPDDSICSRDEWLYERTEQEYKRFERKYCRSNK